MHQGFQIAPESIDSDPINTHPHRHAPATVAATAEQYNATVRSARDSEVQCDTRGVLRPLPTCDGLDVERVAQAIEAARTADLAAVGVVRLGGYGDLRRFLGVDAAHVVDAASGALSHDGTCLFGDGRQVWAKALTLLGRGERPLTARLWYADEGVVTGRLVACVDDAGPGRAFVFQDAAYEDDERLLNAMADTVRFETRKIVESGKFRPVSWRFACLYLWTARPGQAPLNELLLQPTVALLDAVRPALCAAVCRFDRLPAGCQQAYAARSTFDRLCPLADANPTRRKKKRRAALDTIDFTDRSLWETGGDDRFGEHVDLAECDTSRGTLQCMAQCAGRASASREALGKMAVQATLLALLMYESGP
jgi:hypothetical protein